MAIDRKIQKVFGGSLSPSGNIAVYGSKKAGAPTFSDNVETLQSTSWLQGIMGATSTDKAPYVQDLNSLFYVITKQLAYLFQSGVPEWDSQTEYFSGKSLVMLNGKIYVAIQDSTNKSPSTETTYWVEYTDLFTKYIMPSYDANVAASIGGYPQGAILLFETDSGTYRYIRSLVNNNEYTPSSSNIKYPNSESGTYYWEAISNVDSNLFVVNNNVDAVKTYAEFILDDNGYLHINGTKGLAFDNLGHIDVESGLFNINFTNVKVNNNPLIRLPNYAGKIQVATFNGNTPSGWTATADGWVGALVPPANGNNDVWFKVRNVEVFRTTYFSSFFYTGLYPVKEGDYIEARGGGGVWYPGYVYFFPNL